jgi:hypothetical protein
MELNLKKDMIKAFKTIGFEVTTEDTVDIGYNVTSYYDTPGSFTSPPEFSFEFDFNYVTLSLYNEEENDNEYVDLTEEQIKNVEYEMHEGFYQNIFEDFMESRGEAEVEAKIDRYGF